MRQAMWGAGLLLGALLLLLPCWYAVAVFTDGRVFPPIAMLLLTLYVAACAWVAWDDVWAGTLGLYLILRGLITPHVLWFETLTAMTAGLVVYSVARRAPETSFRWVRRAAVIAAGAQVPVLALYALDVAPLAWYGGTFGNPNYAAAFLAMTAAWAPPWLLPFWCAGIVLSKSALAALAFLVALALRFGRRGFPFVGVGVVGMALTIWHRGLFLVPVTGRYQVWRRALILWLTGAPLWGYGPAAWLSAIPKANNELYAWIHNDYLELAFAGGFIALGLLGACVWSHRKALSRPECLPVVAAIAIEATAMFPFQVAGTAVLALTALGFATREDPRARRASCPFCGAPGQIDDGSMSLVWCVACGRYGVPRYA